MDDFALERRLNKKLSEKVRRISEKGRGVAERIKYIKQETIDRSVFIGLFFLIVFFYFKNLNGFGHGDEAYYYLGAKATIENGWIIPKSIPHVYNGMEYIGYGPLVFYVPAVFQSIGLYSYFSPVFGLLTILLVFHIGRKMSFNTGLVAMVLLASTPLFVFLSILSYVDTLVVFLILLSVYTGYNAVEIGDRKHIIIAGFCFGVALLTKLFTVFVPLVFILYMLKFRRGYKPFAWMVLIGFLIWIPWLLRNYLYFDNPLYPIGPQIFGWQYFDREAVDFLKYRSHANVLLLYIFSPNNLWTIFKLLFPLSFFALFVFKKNRLNYTLLFSIIVFVLPVILQVPRATKYIFFVTPFLALFVARVMSQDKRVAAFGLLLAVLASLFIMPSEVNRIVTNRNFGEGMEGAYDWISMNTPEDAVILELIPVNMVYATGRNSTFIRHTGGSEFIDFWTYEEDEALRRLKIQGVTHVVFRTFYFMPDKVLAKHAWTSLPEEAKLRFDEWDSVKLVYDMDGVIIYEVGYGGA